MSLLDNWFKENIQGNVVPLFAEHNLIVETFFDKTMQKLKRSNEFDQLMIRTVETGLQKNTWEGLIYIMYWQRNDAVTPLYVGKAERKGVSNPISYNIENIRKNHHAFGRWGYGLAYHIGDLSHAIFQETAYKTPSKKYKKWGQVLFDQFEPPKLREKVYVAIISWEQGMRGPSGLIGSVPSVEKEIIALAGAIDSGKLLNVDGR